MPWQQQGNKRYYYRSVRVRGRPVRRYVGCGQVAELVAAADDLSRLTRAIHARERRAEQERLAAAEAPLLRLCQAADDLARAALLAANFHQHTRGSWRRRRGTDNDDGTGGANSDAGAGDGPATG